MKKALIFGVSGQDGAYLSRCLVRKGYEVFGTSRDSQMNSFTNLEALGIKDKVRVESVALNDFRCVLQVIGKSEPDEIYNLAGQSSVALSFKQPVEAFESISIGTLNILEVIRFLGKPIRFYNACSSECFGNTADRPADEKTLFNPRSPYAVAKAAAFWEVVNYREAYGIFGCNGLLSNHESPLRPQRFVTKKIVSAAARIAKGDTETLSLGNVSVKRDWGWADEYINAMWRMLQAEEPDDYVIATGETRSLEDFLEEAFECAGLDWKKHVKTDRSLIRPTDVSVNRCNPSKAGEKLGWKAEFHMKEVVRKMMDFELNDGAQEFL